MSSSWRGFRPGSPDEALARQVNFEQLPAHVAIIMDGNGRWAAQRHLPRVEGHRAGIDSVRDVVETSARLGIDVLTLYAFSIENWKRPRAEVNTLMMLLKRYIRLELEHAQPEQHPLPRDRPVRGACRRTCRTSSSSASTDRGEHRACCSTSRSTTAAAPRSSTPRAARSPRASSPDDLDERRFGEFLYTAGQPDPDLLIRTSGEMRVSNFLLWQIAYSEIWVTETLWPDFRRRDLLEAVVAYQKRDRRYGGIKPSPRGARREVTRVLSGAVLLAPRGRAWSGSRPPGCFSRRRVPAAAGLLPSIVALAARPAGCTRRVAAAAAGAHGGGVRRRACSALRHAIPLEAVLMTGVRRALAALALVEWRGGPTDAVAPVPAAFFPALYLGAADRRDGGDPRGCRTARRCSC